MTGLVSSWILVFLLVTAALTSFKLTNQLIHQELQQAKIEDRLLYLDEALTMSARMAAYSGDSAWLDRYNLLKKETNERVHDLSAFEGNSPDIKPLAQAVHDANKALFDLESRAFDDMTRGRQIHAQTILMSDRYELWKSRFRATLRQFATLLENEVALDQRRNQMLLLFVVILVLLLLPLSINTIVGSRSVRQIEQLQIQMLQSSKMAALGEMASGIAHEVNNPLTAILGRASLLIQAAEKDKSLPPLAATHARAIRATALRIAAIIRSLRIFAREDAIEDPRPVDVRDLMEDTLDLCQERFRAHGVELVTRKPRAGLSIIAHPIQISQALLNLLNNAYDAVQDTPSKKISLTVDESPDSVRISVTDTGTGIPQHLREKIMQPFFTTKPVGMGTGLGLSLSRSIVEKHGGTLILDSPFNPTRFIICLPKVPAREFRASEPRAA